jgi:hypothetical protein
VDLALCRPPANHHQATIVNQVEFHRVEAQPLYKQTCILKMKHKENTYNKRPQRSGQRPSHAMHAAIECCPYLRGAQCDESIAVAGRVALRPRRWGLLPKGTVQVAVLVTTAPARPLRHFELA